MNAPSATIVSARRERRSGNLPEVILWRELRKRPGGFKFRRQFPLGRYSLDFACLEARLCIEVDGEAHSRGDRPERDIARDRAMSTAGFVTIRIPARDVLRDVEPSLVAIVAACTERRPLHHRAMPGGPPPRAGEVFAEEPYS